MTNQQNNKCLKLKTNHTSEEQFLKNNFVFAELMKQKLQQAEQNNTVNGSSFKNKRFVCLPSTSVIFCTNFNQSSLISECLCRYSRFLHFLNGIVRWSRLSFQSNILIPDVEDTHHSFRDAYIALSRSSSYRN